MRLYSAWVMEKDILTYTLYVSDNIFMTLT